MSKVKRITVTNIKAIQSQVADFNGCTAIVSGGNNKGKSTLLRVLADRLRGIAPENIIRQGEKEGFYEMELTTGEKFRWNIDTKKEKLTFVSEKDIKSSLTKEIRSYYFPPVFDVDKFLTDEPGKQRKTLSKLSNVDLDEIDKKISAATEERTWARKKQDEEKIKWDAFDAIDPKLPKDNISYSSVVESIQTELNTVALHNEQIKGLVYKVDFKKTSLEVNKKEIEALKLKIKEYEDANMLLETDIDKGETYLKRPEKQIKTESDILVIKNRLSESEEKLEVVNKNIQAIAQKEAWNKSVTNWELADKEVKRLIADKDEAIKTSGLPEGFGFNDEGITYNNLPFNKQSLSTSAVYIAALKLASVGLGEVKTLHFDASSLDRKSLNEVNVWAETQNLQLLIERPDFDGGEITYELIEKHDEKENS